MELLKSCVFLRSKNLFEKQKLESKAPSFQLSSLTQFQFTQFMCSAPDSNGVQEFGVLEQNKAGACNGIKDALTGGLFKKLPYPHF